MIMEYVENKKKSEEKNYLTNHFSYTLFSIKKSFLLQFYKLRKFLESRAS